ncbi:MAG: hypothetical protein E4H20_12370 [Spirochaetales bacterium]|nr:MAG: hypothetical protein E4H20_12370 [Spirochaetales bacterium]
MQAIDKLKSDLDDWERRSTPSADMKALDGLRLSFSRTVGSVPEETISAIFTSFLGLYGSVGPRQGAKAIEWLGGVGSLFLMDYDGTPFSKAEWEDIRELVTLDAGEIDMDVLSYILSVVMEHGAL